MTAKAVLWPWVHIYAQAFTHMNVWMYSNIHAHKSNGFWMLSVLMEVRKLGCHRTKTM